MIIITTDGSFIPGHNVGGWACDIKYNGQTYELMGSMFAHSAIEAELTAIYKGLQIVPLGEQTMLYTDCGVIISIIENHNSWIRNNQWPKWSHQIIGLIRGIIEFLSRHNPKIVYIGGHNSPRNKRCDTLAYNAARAKLRRSGINAKILKTRVPKPEKISNNFELPVCLL